MLHDPARSKNALLARLGATDLASLRLQHVDLRRSQLLARRGLANDHVYFLEDGIASIVIETNSNGHPVEVAMVGREGAIGLAAITGSAKAHSDVVMLLAGSGWRAPIQAVASAFEASAAVRSCTLDDMQTLISQISSTSAANARNKTDERLARWLLMAHDRAGADELAVTHDVVARMLGVRRAGISIALKDFERHGVIAGRRGAIRVIDRLGLIAQTHGAYAPAEEHVRPRAVSSPQSPVEAPLAEPSLRPNEHEAAPALLSAIGGALSGSTQHTG
jgi:CRP-like cAMP-binding protein